MIYVQSFSQIGNGNLSKKSLKFSSANVSSPENLAISYSDLYRPISLNFRQSIGSGIYDLRAKF